MTDWIKYDGTNKPDEDVLVRVRFNCGEESHAVLAAGEWRWSHDDDLAYLISHFQLKDAPND